MEMPCIISAMDIEEYHALPPISRSNLMTFKKSPYHYWYKYISGQYVAPEPSVDLVLGNAVHCYLLEYGQFWDRYIVKDKVDRRTKAGKQKHDANLIEAGNRIMLNNEQLKLIQAMSRNVEMNPDLKNVTSGSTNEASIFWTDKETGLDCKARPDIWQKDYNFVADVKTCRDASLSAFQKDIFAYGYHLQCAMIREGILAATGESVNDFVFIAMEKVEPYPVGCYQLDALALQRGIDEFRYLIESLKRCLDSNKWPQYDNGIVRLPAWMEVGE